jgi:curved DNA-binding protein
MQFKDYYATLGVDKSATQDDIKRSYRKLARKYHPDLNKDEGAEEKFKELGEANEVLSDPEKRAAYDQLGQSYQPGQDFRPPPNWDEGFEFSGRSYGDGARAHEFSDFFDDLFGSSYRTQRSSSTGARFHARGQDHHARITVDLEDSFTGAKRSIALRAPELTDDGLIVLKPRTLEVSIPKGVHQGQQIRLKGQGSPGHGGGSAGDLYLEIVFKPHRLYHADGTDLYLDFPVTPWEAALGAKVKAPTPGGIVEITIPAGSKQGGQLRLKGRGIPAKSPGDIYVVLQITLPPADNDQAKKLYETMAQGFKFDPRAHMI